MKSIVAALITFNIISTACATEVAGSKSPNPTESQVPTFLPPAEDTLPDNAYGRLVQQGHAIFVDTKTNASEFVGKRTYRWHVVVYCAGEPAQPLIGRSS